MAAVNCVYLIVMDLFNNAIEEYRKWCENTRDDTETQNELLRLENAGEELFDSFGGDLGFGTSGIRGLLGVGPRRINKYVIARATQGLSNYINRHNIPEHVSKVVIAYDSRHNSKELALETARVLSGNGINVYIFSEITPVPVLSFSIEELECDYGIMITASHNAGVFNGYKVFSRYGYQIVGEEPDGILSEMNKLDYFNGILRSDDNIQFLDSGLADRFIAKVQDVIGPFHAIDSESNIKIVYTPLNGAGNQFIKKALKNAGFNDIVAVPSQDSFDPDFTTCKTPNPERLSAYSEAFRVLDQAKADIIIASDPDSDRVGVALIHDGTKVNLTGNQIGLLILDYLCNNKDLKCAKYCFRSIVSTPLVDRIADSYGLETVTTLTGFKYIGEKIEEIIQSGRPEEYLFGFEESNGFLIAPFLKDKDAISTAVIIAVIANYQKNRGNDLIDHLNEIYTNYGTLIDRSKSFTFEGLLGQETMNDIMNHFRTDVVEQIGDLYIEEKTDYLVDDTGLPASDIIRFDMDDGSTAIIRPSGTEPKMKVYYFLTDATSTIDRGITDIIESFR